MSLFAAVTQAPRDPILGLNEAFQADPRALKVNLGVGVYYDAQGRIPLLQAVAEAERLLLKNASARTYLPIEGMAAYNQHTQTLLFGADASVRSEERVLTAQTLGGTGALKLGADLLKSVHPDAVVAISNPSWENHQALFENAGLQVAPYRYYQTASSSVDIAGLLADLKALPERSIVLLHACCHNPTGADLTASDWQKLLAVVQERAHIPFIDMAYQGFAAGIEEDAAAVRLFAQSGISYLVANSYSKSFGLYGERVGALSIITSSAEQTPRVLSQLKRMIRTNYSSPPTHGASLVAGVLGSDELKALWRSELEGMRTRIQAMRTAFVAALHTHQSSRRFDFILKQNGMFSYSGLTAPQVEQLRVQYGIYAVGTGRLCMAALNANNLDSVTQAIATVVSEQST